MILRVPISVVIPTYNQGKILKLCLSFLQKQSVLPKEIIVVDNQSSDDTPEVIQSYIKKIPICYLKEKKIGPSFARNTGITKAEGKIIALLDSDCLPCKNWLKSIWDFYQSHRDVILQGNWINKPIKKSLASDLYLFSLELHRNVILNSLRKNIDFDNKKKQGSINFFDTKNVAFPKTLIKEKGLLFDNRLPIYAEDVDFGVQVVRKNIPIVFNKKLIVRHLFDISLWRFLKMNFKIGLARVFLQEKWRFDVINRKKLGFWTKIIWNQRRKKFITNQERMTTNRYLASKNYLHKVIFRGMLILRKLVQLLGRFYGFLIIGRVNFEN